jgi:ribulose-phosphate 3-epimerase
MNVLIAPSILASDFARLGEEVRALDAGGANLVHVDVMDGHFVPPITIGQGVVKSLSGQTDLPLDVHLMVSNPEGMLEDFARAGADWLTVHVEAVTHLDRTLAHIRELGMKAGVSLNPATPLETVEWVLEKCDLVLIMAVNPGYGGQQFIPYCLSKVEKLKTMIVQRNLPALVSVDGGVKLDNCGELSRAGADVLVAGSAIFGTPDYGDTIAAFRTRAKAALNES